MEIIELLKKLKHIEPNSEYTRISRRTILSTPHIEAASVGFLRIFMRTLEAGSTVALTALFIVLVLGGFAVGNFFSPIKLASLDPSTLRAEAEAIDIQIKLTRLQYLETQSSLASLYETTTAATAKTFSVPKLGVNTVENPVKSAGSSTEDISFEQVLEVLSK